MLKSNLCEYSDASILVKKTMSVGNVAEAMAAANNDNKEVICQICVPFTDCIREINNTQVDNAKDNDVVHSMYNVTEHSNG